MTDKDRIEKLVRLLRKQVPDLTIAVDAPTRPKGDWFIDTKLGRRTFVIEYRPNLGFGLSSTPSEGIGEGPDEFLETEDETVERLVDLLQNGRKTEPQRVRLLQELREQKRVSQVELAERLGVRQPTISKLERRDDLNLNTLRRYIQALGGELEITARFPDGPVEIGPVPRAKKHARTGR